MSRSGTATGGEPLYRRGTKCPTKSTRGFPAEKFGCVVVSHHQEPLSIGRHVVGEVHARELGQND